MSTIAEFAKNKRETLRIELTQFNGRDVVNARIWAPKEGVGLVPTPKGLTISPDLLPQLIGGLQAAQEAAIKLGIVSGENA